MTTEQLVTEKELQNAYLQTYAPGSGVLKLAWWKELQKLTGAYSPLDVLHGFIDAMFFVCTNQREEIAKIPCLNDKTERLNIMRRAMLFLGQHMERHRFRDILGAADQELRGKNSQDGTGAFYTPDSLCLAMAEMQQNPELIAKLEAGEIVTCYDPTIGAGRTCLAFAELNQKYLHLLRFYGTDIEINAVRMCYVNFALNGIAARCVHGNELSNDREWAVYYTPEWHVYEYDRNIKLQMDKWRATFESMQETVTEIVPVVSPTQAENAQDTPVESEKMDVTIEADGQITFNF